jgi:phage terminase large subunit-like protein
MPGTGSGSREPCQRSPGPLKSSRLSKRRILSAQHAAQAETPAARLTRIAKERQRGKKSDDDLKNYERLRKLLGPIESLTVDEAEAALADWTLWAKLAQLPPARAQGGLHWTVWLMLGGRGAGKTRAGAEWLRAQMEGATPLGPGACRAAALVADTLDDARRVMVEGPSGLLAIAAADQKPHFAPSLRRLKWPNGAEAHLFSSEDPDGLRGPQFDVAWCDELAKWRYAEATFDMLQFALRLGDQPRQVVTTTPRPVPLVRRLVDDPLTAVTSMTTNDNAANLAASFLTQIIERYRGTRLGRQEILGEILEDNPYALWRADMVEPLRVREAPAMARIVVAVDPPAGMGESASECGIVVAGRGQDGQGYVLADASAGGLSPAAWARRAVALYREYEADRIVAEVNQGGDMVRTLIEQTAPAVPVRQVRATRGKKLRAEPVAALYEQGRVHHVGAFPGLEDQMFTFGVDGGDGRSPDRVDALVWALTDLMIDRARDAKPRVRRL